ncbi:MAG: GTP 3',8-cyclase MoaA [Candidatus Omnitrophota bacterium]
MLIDSYGRKIDYLRISVTDRCNLRCIYCMPQAGIIHKPQSKLLSFEEIARVVEIMSALGVEKIRLTGGEPLLRKGVVDLVKSLSGIKGISDISMTTNGILLKEYASALKQAGLKRLNISLDSLHQERYSLVTRQGKLERVLEGIEQAQNAGISPIKINVLLLDGMSVDEIMDFLRVSIENSLHVRFLEFMPVNSFYKIDNFISARDVIDIARKCFALEDAAIYGNGPAEVFKIKNALGTFGVISPMSSKFCFKCNRLRLSSDGFLKPCLHSELKMNLRVLLRSSASDDDLAEVIKSAAAEKPKEHNLDKGEFLFSDYSMCQIGG